MAVSDLEYALLAANVYGTLPEVKSAQNNLPIPTGWVCDLTVERSSVDGFMAKAYSRDNEIVISFAGTTAENSLDWTQGNIPAGSGLSTSPQVVDAALLCQQILNDPANQGKTVTFTGHSLGGGLASVMAEYFNKGAVVFDQAPFAMSANTAAVVNDVKAACLAQGALPLEFAQFNAGDNRQSNVRAIAIEGEILSRPADIALNVVSILSTVASDLLFTGGHPVAGFVAAYLAGLAGDGVGRIAGSTQVIDLQAHSSAELGWGWGAATDALGIVGNPIDLHSQALLTANLMSPSFTSTVQAHRELLPSIFANPDYVENPALTTATPLELFVQRQYRGEGALDKLASDINLINVNQGLTSTDIVIRGMLNRVEIAGLYEQAHLRTPDMGSQGLLGSVLNATAGGLEFNLASLGTQGAKLHDDLDQLISHSLYNAPNQGYVYDGTEKFVVQSGTDPLVRSSLGTQALVLLGYTGADTLFGSTGNDLISGHLGADFIAAGAGDDLIYAGDGDDSIFGGDGSDSFYLSRVHNDFGAVPTYTLFDVGGAQDTLVLCDIASTVRLTSIADLSFKKSGNDLVVNFDIAINGVTVDSDEGRVVITAEGAGSVVESLRIVDVSHNTVGEDISLVSIWNALVQIGDSDFHKFTTSSLGSEYGQWVVANGSAVSDGAAPVLFGQWFYGTDPWVVLNILGNDSLVGTAGNDCFVGSRGVDVIDGGAGVDKFIADFDFSADRYISYATNLGGLYSNTSLANIKAGMATAGSYLRISDFYSGIQSTVSNVEQFAVSVTGSVYDDLLIYQGGTHYFGGAGADTFYADWSAATNAINWVNNPGVTQTVNGVQVSGLERLLLQTGSGNDQIDNSGANGNDEIWTGAGNDSVNGGAGSDTLNLGGGDDQAYGSRGVDTIDGGAGTDKFTADFDFSADHYISYATNLGGLYSNTSLASIKAGMATAGSYLRISDFYSGIQSTVSNVEQFAVSVTGSVYDDLLIYQGGTHYFGGAGADTFYADWSAATNAINWVNNPGVTQTVNGVQVSGLERLLLQTGSGNDQIDNSRANGNDEIWTGAGNDSVNGGAGSDRIEAGLGNDVLNGGLGSDTMVGGGGNDVYYVDDASDQVVEDLADAATGGVDLIVASVNFTLAANVERLQLQGSSALNATGNALDNSFWASAGNNVIDGAAGADTVFYSYAAAGVSVNLGLTTAQATGGSGSDTLLNVEHLVGTAYADQLTGNAASNSLSGGAGNDTLNGGAGVDTMTGGDGNDTFYVDSSSDVAFEGNADLLSGGDDLVVASASYTLGNNIERLQLVGTAAINGGGNALNNRIWASAGNNVINGAAGADTVDYSTATAGITLNLGLASAQATGGSGTDTLLNVEHLVGSAFNDRFTGNALANSLGGGAGNDTLDGAAGADSLSGGDGNDTYYVDNSADVVTETNAVLATGGIDLVVASASFALGANLERLQLAGTAAINATGNGLDNLLWANAGDNVIDGGAGADTVYYSYATAGVSVDLGLATAQATGGSGNDTLLNVEHLVGSAFADTLTGNAAANSLSGGAGADTLDGGAGADTLSGGDGNDTYFVDSSSDVVFEGNASLGTGGDDLVIASVSHTLGNNVERLQLVGAGALNGTGNALDNVLWAGAGNNVINGAGGADTVSYALAGAGVTVNLGTGSAQATGGSGSDTLLNVEHLIGSAFADRLTGNAAANSLSGGAGADTLDGGAGADALEGGDGNDIYYVDSLADLVIETNASTATGGIDLVIASATTTLAANVERLQLVGAGAVDGTGNGLDNLFWASAGDNVLDGDGGSDTVYYSYATSGVNVNLSLTTAQATGGSGTDTLWYVENLVGSAYADRLTGDALVNALSGGAGNDVLDGGASADVLSGGDGADVYYVDNTADVVFEGNADSATGGIDLVYTTANFTLGANVERMFLLGGAINGTGNGLDNVIFAGAGNNTIDGGAGLDTVSYGTAAAGVTVDLALGGLQATGGSGLDMLLNVEHLVGTSQADHLGGNAGANTLSGNAGADWLSGAAGNDILVAGDGADTLVGGTGNDVLNGADVGAVLADTFVWQLGDQGLAGVPASDSINGFTAAAAAAGGDVLDLRDLLLGETAATLQNYLDVVTTGTTTTLRVSTGGGFAGGVYAANACDQTITLTDVDLRLSFGLAANAPDDLLIQEMLNRGKLLVGP